MRLDDISIYKAFFLLAIHAVACVICYHYRLQGLSLNTAEGNPVLCYPIAMVGVVGLIGFVRHFERIKPIATPVAYIGRNSVYFYPLTGYFPVALVNFLGNQGVVKNIPVVLISKFSGFLVAFVVKNIADIMSANLSGQLLKRKK